MRFRYLSAAVLAFGMLPVLHAQQWITPTPDELKMTSIPEVPGADAVILNRDELDDDDLHVKNIYYRVKILSEKGLQYGDVELEFDKRHDSRGYTIGEIYARTIQPDGSIVPFTGKPYDKVIEKDKENAYSKRVFSLPAVKVGSIIEYRYTVRWDDHIFFSPDWIIQGDLFVKKAHFLWKPTDKELVATRRGGRESFSQRIAWSKSLPPGLDVVNKRLPTGRINIEVNISDVMPFTSEQYMPPIASSRYHVFFYYTPYYSVQDYWNTEIGYWNSDTGKFTNTGGSVGQQAHELTAGATSDEQKARMLYKAVTALENTDYTRNRTSAEEKNAIKSAEDVLKRKHGSSDQIAMTYVALARAAGLKASSMAVTNRSNRMLDVNWQEFNQMSDIVAVVTYGGAEHFLDPGTPFTPFGHLSWDHTISGGVRQDNPDKTKQFSLTPSDTYRYSHVSRVGDIKLDETGHMSGKVILTYEGNPAVRWRHIALRNDDAELRDRLKREIESMLPAETEVKLESIAETANGEAPLKVIASIQGRLGNSVGSRVMLPSALFELNSRPAFPHEKRDFAVYFPYPEYVQDAVRYTLPAGWSVESAPTTEQAKFQNLAAYTLGSQQASNSITVRRDFILGDVYFPNDQYKELRTFYNDLEAKDHANVVIRRTATTASAAAPTQAK